ncbi:MAG TPA: hypothetical protein VFD83_00525 [Candidatus Polarisedimenticolia bacterium]|nr:hypothetical protein [Candidatus Polarisedimenticolia bacterium]
MNLEFGKVVLVVLFALAPLVGIAMGFGAPALRARGPLFVAFFAGLIPIIAMYVPKKFMSGDTGMSPRLDQWLIIVAGFALLLGVVNVIQNSTRRIARKESGWFFSMVLLAGLFITGGIGIWSTITGEGITTRPDGSVTPFQWIANNMFQPLQSTIFALLAFFMASAAFRAFRARNTEATILLIAGILVMAGRVPLLEFLAAPFPPLQPGAAAASQGLGKLTEWIMQVPNGAAQSGIIIGAALGAASMAIRVILGIEKGYLGLGAGE